MNTKIGVVSGSQEATVAMPPVSTVAVKWMLLGCPCGNSQSGFRIWTLRLLQLLTAVKVGYKQAGQPLGKSDHAMLTWGAIEAKNYGIHPDPPREDGMTRFSAKVLS